MTTDSFILALRRFISRRGHPKTMWSDNGLNFVGAKNELYNILAKLNEKKINDFLVNKSSWKFIPPNSLWMGGAWESIVKITKRALETVTKDRAVYEETLNTFFTEVESTLNSRPLLQLTDDVNDLDVLTPNNFLIGRQNYNFRLTSEESKMNLRSRWKSVQNVTNMLWARLIKEYIPTLNIRKKWHKQERSFKINDIVLVKKDNVKRCHWPLGRIAEVYKSKDENVRSAKVKMANSTLVRPANSLCLLEASK